VRPRFIQTPAPVVLAAVPDPRRRPSDGAIVEASVLARVLGMRVLALDATVVLVPAQVRTPSPEVQDPGARTIARTSGLAPTGSGVAGARLAEAVRSINEGAELLAQARRNGA